MNARQILERVEEAKRAFGPLCKKYAGAVTAEAFREAVRDGGHNVSPRDSFIRGISVEVDLLVVRPHAQPRFGCLYEPSDVLAAIEIKNSGTFGKSGIDAIRTNFDKIIATHRDIRCCYVTLAERKTYKWRVTPKNLRFPAFTCFWHTESKNINPEETGEWKEFLDWLSEARP